MQPSPVLAILGLLLTILSAAMLIPASFDLVTGHQDWHGFAFSALITGFVGVCLWLANKSHKRVDLGVRDAFLLTNGAWFFIGIFGALPFLFSSLDLGLADALFESVSGITTTGSTVLSNIEQASYGLLIWRALLQWMGGVGIVVMAMAVLPMLSVGGMQLFKTESFDAAEKVIPRARQLAGGIFAIYSLLTGVWMLMLMMAGMDAFDALAHAMTTLATGGYSTKTASIAAFDSLAVEIIIIAGMIVGSLPFVHYLAMARGGWRSLLRDPQVSWFAVILIAVVMLLSFNLFSTGMDVDMAIRNAAFNGISIITGTGYGTSDFASWGGFATTLLLICMFIGGCAGSTTCGIKIFRLQVLAGTIRVQFARLVRPHGVVLSYYAGRPVPESVMDAVMGFFYLYMLCFIGIAVLLGLTGVDFDTALSGAATAISNVGPGLGGTIGPAGHFGSLPDMSKYILCFGMLLGRLELFTVLVVLNPMFWKS